MKRAVLEFVSGATRPSLGSLVGTLGTLALLVGLCACLVTPRRVAEGADYFSTGVNDEYPSLTADAIRIAESRSEHLSVAILGDSSIREAISDSGDLARKLSQRLGREVDVHLLTAGGLSLFEQVALSDYIRDHVRGVILLEAAPYNYSAYLRAVEPWALNRLGFQSEALRDELRRAGRRPPPRFGNYFLDNLNYFTARCDQLTKLRKAHPPATQHMFRSGPSWTDAEWDRYRARVFGWERNYHKAKQGNFEICQRQIRHLQDRGGISVGLLVNVENPSTADHALPHERRLWNEYRKDIRRFALDQNVPLLDVAATAGLRPEDFLDYTHVGSAGGRNRYTAALAAAVAEMLKRQSLPK